jgi:hypothetical protein
MDIPEKIWVPQTATTKKSLKKKTQKLKNTSPKNTKKIRSTNDRYHPKKATHTHQS